MCTQKPPHDYSEQLYNRYRDVFCVYINESVSTCQVQSQVQYDFTIYDWGDSKASCTWSGMM